MILVNNVNTNKLHDELIAQGVIPTLVENDCQENDYIAQNTWITFSEGTDMILVQQIIDAHDPAPLPTPLTETEILRQELNEVTLLLGDLLLGGA